MAEPHVAPALGHLDVPFIAQRMREVDRLQVEVQMLTVFGSMAVAAMMVSYWLEPRPRWFLVLFAAASLATSVYSGMVQAYPITAIEAIWALIAMQRFYSSRQRPGAPRANPVSIR